MVCAFSGPERGCVFFEAAVNLHPSPQGQSVGIIWGIEHDCLVLFWTMLSMLWWLACGFGSVSKLFSRKLSCRSSGDKAVVPMVW